MNSRVWPGFQPRKNRERLIYLFSEAIIFQLQDLIIIPITKYVQNSMVKNKRGERRFCVLPILWSHCSHTHSHTHSGVKIWKKCNLGNISCIFFSFLSHCDDSHRAQIRDEVEDDNNSSIFMIKKNNISCQISFTFVMFMILIYKFVKILTTSPMYYKHTHLKYYHYCYINSLQGLLLLL